MLATSDAKLKRKSWLNLSEPIRSISTSFSTQSAHVQTQLSSSERNKNRKNGAKKLKRDKKRKFLNCTFLNCGASLLSKYHPFGLCFVHGDKAALAKAEEEAKALRSVAVFCAF